MPEQAVIDRLNTTLRILDQNVGYKGELTEVTHSLVPDIPTALLNVLLHSTEMADEFFLGYNALSEQDVIGFYKNPSAPLSFFGAYQFASDFLLTEDMEIALENTLNDELVEPDIIRDIGKLLPVFQFQGDFIVADFSDQRSGALLTIVDGHIASILAPGILEHLHDLRDGLEQGAYHSDEDGLVFPSAWYQRLGVRAGTLKMDEYGEVEE